MEFANVKSVDALIDELLTSNPAHGDFLNYIVCLLKILAAAPHQDILGLIDGFSGLFREVYDEIEAAKPHNILKRVKHFRSLIRKGHEASRGAPAQKIEALDDFNAAKSLADGLLESLETQKLPTWPFVLLRVEAKSHMASCYTYNRKYSESVTCFNSAEIDLQQMPFHTQGLNDKKVALKAFQIPPFIIKMAQENTNILQIRERMDTRFAETTHEVQNALIKGGAHPDSYVAPLSQWITECLNEGRLRLRRYLRDQFDHYLRRADHREYMTMTGKYLANLGWSDLFLFSKVEDEELIKTCTRNFSLAGDSIVDGLCNAEPEYDRAEKGAELQYYQDTGFYSPEAQISLSRISTYKLALYKLAPNPTETSLTIENLNKLWLKDLKQNPPAYRIPASIASAARHLNEMGLGHVWEQVFADFPQDLKERISLCGF